jgi:zinc transport system substrate-binding protein
MTSSNSAVISNNNKARKQSMKPYYRNRWQLAFWMALTVLVNVYPATAGSPLNIYVVNYPLKYFAERIGGPHVKVTLPVPADEDPVYWTPGVADIGAYQQADLILLNGAGYAKWVGKVSLPRSKTVDTSRGFKDRYIIVKETMTHSHGAEGEHAHEGPAFTTWLDFSLAAKQAEAVAEALARRRPQQKDLFMVNYQSLEKDLMELDSRIKDIVSSNDAKPIIFSHPVYDYFEKAYGLNGRSVHWEPDQDPSPDQIAELNQLLDNHPAKWMILEATPIKSAVDVLEVKGIQNVVFDPCGKMPFDSNFLTVMQQNVSNLELVFQQ